MSTAMIITIVQAAIAAGVQAEPFLAALFAHKASLEGQDVPAADLIALDAAIELLEKHIEARTPAPKPG